MIQDLEVCVNGDFQLWIRYALLVLEENGRGEESSLILLKRGAIIDT